MMGVKNLTKGKKQIAQRLMLLGLGITLLTNPGNVYAASREDELIAAIERQVARQDTQETKNAAQSPTGITERIQAILDEAEADRKGTNKKPSTNFVQYENPYKPGGSESVTEEDSEENDETPAPAKTEVRNPAPSETTTAGNTPPALPPIPAKVPELVEGRYNFDWQGTPIAQSLYAVAKIAHRDVVVNGDLKGNVYISLHQVTCNEAMDYLSRAFNFNWEADGNAILVSTDKLMKQSQTFKIRHAVDLEKVQGELTALGIDSSNIYANKEARSVSVTGTPYQLRQATRLLNNIDKPVSQCLVLAQLIEINHGKDLNLGIQYSLPTYSHTGTTDGITNSDSFRGNWLEKLTFSASSQASKALSKGHVISRPMIMMMNGQEGMVYFGENVPVLSATSTSASTNITVEYHEVGTKLTITPAINEDEGEIALNIKTEVSNISQWLTSGYTQAPQISTRQATTSAHLHSGQSFVIGGLMSATELDNLSGIPGLMDLPILGKLFSYHTKSKDYAEVYIMITPYIVTDDINPKEILQKLED